MITSDYIALGSLTISILALILIKKNADRVFRLEKQKFTIQNTANTETQNHLQVQQQHLIYAAYNELIRFRDKYLRMQRTLKDGRTPNHNPFSAMRCTNLLELHENYCWLLDAKMRGLLVEIINNI
jgi:hypothetical protein